MNNKITTFYLSAFIAAIMACGFISTGTAYATGTVYLNQEFENPVFPIQGWSVANTSGYNWIRTSYASGYGTGAASVVVDFYDWASGNFDLITPQFAATTAGDSLVFDHAYATAVGGYNDRMDIFTSTDGGASWTMLISLVGGNSGPLVTAPATNDLFIPTSGQWATKRYLLPVGTNKIKFEAVSAFGNNLYMDNVKIGARYNNDAGVNSLVVPKWAITPQTMSPQVNVKNFGNSTQTFNVTMTISPGGYSNTQSVSNLAGGQSTVVTFSSFNFSTVGNYTVTAYSSLGGDQNVSNDTITNTIVVTPAVRNPVLEFCTGTWCQWCPCGDAVAHHLWVTYPNAVILAYHGAGSDPWITFNGNGIIGLLGLSGYPSGYIDRRLGPGNNGWGSFFSDAEYRMSTSPAGTVNIAPTSVNYNTGTRVLTANFDATALTTLSGQYKVIFVITEDNLVYPQTGNSYCPGNSNAVHNWVTRNIVNGASGTNINSGTWNQNQVYPLTFTTTLTTGWVSGNCRYNVVVYRDNATYSLAEVQQGSKGYIDLTGINPEGTVIPKTYSLAQNFPNPFNPVTNVHFSIPKDGAVSFKLYNALGQLVETYMDGFLKAGNYNAEIDGTNFASGVYFYTLSAGDFVQTKKMILTK
jgi:hypothetical protein